jgi:hypothetical protein
MFGCRSLVPLGIALAAVAAPLRAQTVPANFKQVQVLLKVLSYDRALDRNGSGGIVVAVLYDGESSTSSQARAGAVQTVRAAAPSALGNQSVRVAEIDVSRGDLAAQLRSCGAVAAYLTSGLEGHLRAVAVAASKAHVTTLASSEGYAESGVAVGAESLADGRVALFVNLPAARAGGADLASSVLRLATVIR